MDLAASSTNEVTGAVAAGAADRRCRLVSARVELAAETMPWLHLAGGGDAITCAGDYERFQDFSQFCFCGENHVLFTYWSLFPNCHLAGTL